MSAFASTWRRGARRLGWVDLFACRSNSHRHTAQLRVEQLEDRTMLAVKLNLSGVQSAIVGSNINMSNQLISSEAEFAIDINPKKTPWK